MWRIWGGTLEWNFEVKLDQRVPDSGLEELVS